MLKIPTPELKSALKVRITQSAKADLEQYVGYIKNSQPHATTDDVVEAMINKIIPRAGKAAKEFNEYKKNLK